MAAFMLDPELEERRSLLRAAVGGNEAAQLKLEREYHVRVYSASECERYAGTIRSETMPRPVRRKIDHIAEKMTRKTNQ